MTAPRQVAVVQHCFPHYRLALFRLMSQQEPPAPQYSVYYGQEHRAVGLHTLDPLEGLSPEHRARGRFRTIRNRWMTKYCCWQGEAIRLALGRQFDTLILAGNMYHFSTWIAAALARLRGKRVLFWTHGLQRRNPAWKWWLRTRFYRLANALLLYGQHGRRLCMEAGLHPDALYVCLNSLDLDEQTRVRRGLSRRGCKAVRQRLFADADLPLLIWVGRLQPSKQCDLLIKTAKLLSETGRPVNVLLVGDGPSTPSLKQLTEELDLTGHVQFYGPCWEEKDLGPMIAAADVFVCPGAVGLSCMHSLAYGTPVITHDDWAEQLPEAEAIVPGKTGALYRRGSVEDLSRVIAEWLAAQQPRETIRSECYAMVDNYYNPRHQIRVFNAAVSGIPVEEGPCFPRRPTFLEGGPHSCIEGIANRPCV